MRHEAATWRVGERRLDKEERAADSNQVLGSKPGGVRRCCVRT